MPEIVHPGTVRRMSSIRSKGEAMISSLVMTVTSWGASNTFISLRVAVTTTSSRRCASLDVSLPCGFFADSSAIAQTG
ncbi:MAG: hypothetical protein U5R49_02505 [Deltaproteobacteria bacterium]|nr:hypothetical protein [Deltaproteobacteria bacterium]